MIDVCLLGIGGMMPLPYRYLTSLMLRYNGKGMLVDYGERPGRAQAQRLSPKPIDMMLSHPFSCGPYFGSSGNVDNGKCGAHGAGPDGRPQRTCACCQQPRVIAPELPFEIRFLELSEREQEIELPGEPTSISMLSGSTTTSPVTDMLFL